MQTHRTFFLSLFGFILIIFIGIGIWIALKSKTSFFPSSFQPGVSGKLELTTSFGNMTQFKTDAEFKEYMQQNKSSGNYGGGIVTNGALRMDKAVANTEIQTTAPQAMEEPSRVSQTNVQVFGIDEPDIVKTNGDSLFYSQPLQQIVPIIMDGKRIPGVMKPNIFPLPPPEDLISTGGIFSIKPFPPQSIKKQARIAASGDLLLSKDVLVVFNENDWNKRSVDGYDVSNPSTPTKKWSIPYKSNSSKLNARLYQDKLYLVTRLDTGSNFPCPIRLFVLSGNQGTIPCREIYYPTTTVTTDTIYTVSKINTADGTIEKNISFVGSTNNSTLYMSKDALYLTYYYSGDIAKIMYSFVSQNADLYPTYVVDKLKKLQDYDISLQAKQMEVGTLLSNVTLGMDDSKRLVFENNVQNRMRNFMAVHARELERTGIVKINRGNFNIEATGDISGQVLNQYSLDEFNNHLRIATTIGQNNWFGNFGQLTQSFSDIYVLDNSLNTVGSVKDLGKSERIYSARFIADRGYIVTFRQTDPFYILDLSNPNNPQLKGELKIPGYSSYLHPLTENIILGIGKDGDKVKLSLFDIANAGSPLEVDKFTMSEYWSEALNNPHAFLADEQHKVFFMPASQGGYVFSYQNNKLALVAAVADMQVQRAVYINNYLYVLGQNKIIVLDESNWGKVGELSL